MNVVGVIDQLSIVHAGNSIDRLLTFNRWYQLESKAHDGFIELAKTFFRPDRFPYSYILPVSATHMIEDGRYNGIDLTKKTNRQILFQTLVKTSIELSEMR